jgi:ABC-type sugar transport system permease subunit
MKMETRMTLKRKRSLAGLLFVSPFLVGFIFLVIGPVIQSILYSFSKITVGDNGMFLTNVGLANYRQALFVDVDFTPAVIKSLYTLPVQLGFIIIYSFFIANLLNQKFKGRTFSRAIFFLPVIVTSGVLYMLQNYNPILGSANGMINSGAQGINQDSVNLAGSMLNLLSELFYFSPLLIDVVQSTVSQIYFIAISSGVQILIFLAGLQTISPSIYEACKIEGATSWESFWKITFPLMSPLILVNSIYTIIDIMSGVANPIIARCFSLAFIQLDFGFSSAMMWIYMITVFTIIITAGSIIRKRVYYENP